VQPYGFVAFILKVKATARRMSSFNSLSYVGYIHILQWKSQKTFYDKSQFSPLPERGIFSDHKTEILWSAPG